MAEEWVRNARDEVNVEAYSRANAERALGALNEEHAELTRKLKEAESTRLSAEVGLKLLKPKSRTSAKSSTQRSLNWPPRSNLPQTSRPN